MCFSVLACDRNNSDAELLYYAKYSAESSKGCNSQQADLEIDFAKRDGSKVANLQKFDMFSPNWAYVDYVDHEGLDERSMDQLKYLQYLKSESYRIDLMAGSSGIGYTPELEVGDWTDDAKTLKNVYEFYDRIMEYGVRPYYIMVSNPKYVWADKTDKSGMKKTPDMDLYRDYCYNLAKSFKDSGRRVTFETWNEPDLNVTSY